VTELPHEDLGRAAARGGVWTVAGEISSRASQSIVFFVLAGFLSPAQFGAAAVAFVCIQVVNAVTYAGLGSAVQVLGQDEARDRTAVGVALVLGGAGAVVLCLAAGPLCDLLGVPEAVNLVRLIGLALPLLQTGEVLSALLARDLQFRVTGLAVIIGSAVAAAVGLGLAATGAGAGALVAEGVVHPAVRMLVLVIARPSAFRPLLRWAHVTELWTVGRELLLSNAFETAASNIDNVAVSAIAGAAALGAYGFAYNLTALPIFVVGFAMGRVALPIYTRLRASPDSIGPAFLWAVEGTVWLSALPLGFLAVAGPEALDVLFGDKWQPVSGTLRLLALYGLLRCVETGSTTVLIALGEAATTRRVQQWQLALGAVLLVPLVQLDGPFGAASAITIAVVVGTSYSLLRSTQRTHASRGRLLLRVVESVVGGALGGGAGLLVLRTVGNPVGLPLSLLAATLVWGLVFVVLRPRSAARVRGLLRAAPPV
jgi:PST family polysaccharide transporter